MPITSVSLPLIRQLHRLTTEEKVKRRMLDPRLAPKAVVVVVVVVVAAAAVPQMTKM